MPHPVDLEDQAWADQIAASLPPLTAAEVPALARLAADLDARTALPAAGHQRQGGRRAA